jgi:hypothetical protein
LAQAGVEVQSPSNNASSSSTLAQAGVEAQCPSNDGSSSSDARLKPSALAQAGIEVQCPSNNGSTSSHDDGLKPSAAVTQAGVEAQCPSKSTAGHCGESEMMEKQPAGVIESERNEEGESSKAPGGQERGSTMLPQHDQIFTVEDLLNSEDINWVTDNIEEPPSCCRSKCDLGHQFHDLPMPKGCPK